MHIQRHIVANLLLAVLVYGGLLAPLHHSIYMALGGFYAMEGHHDEAAACHEMAPVHVDGERLIPKNDGHPECPFMELFTISLLSYSPNASSITAQTQFAVQSYGIPAFYWQDTTHNSYFLRGPPLG